MFTRSEGTIRLGNILEPRVLVFVNLGVFSTLYTSWVEQDFQEYESGRLQII